MSFPVDEARSRRRCHRNLAKAIGSPAQLAPMSAFPFDLVVFDLDGTLVDTGPDLTAALNHVLHRMGRQTVTEAAVRDMVGLRSEEHTSELQSLMRISYAVFCLKKKKNDITLQNN